MSGSEGIEIKKLFHTVGVAALLVLGFGVQAAEIHDAVRSGELERIQELIVSDNEAVYDVLPGGVTALHIASAVDHVDAVRLLIANGAKVDAESDSGSTPLHWAAMMNAATVIPALLEFGANQDAETDDDMTARMIAERRGSIEALAALNGATEATWQKRTRAPVPEPAVEPAPEPKPIAETAPAPRKKVRQPEPAIDMAQYKRGKLAYKGGDRERAYEIFTALFSDHPDSERVNMALGMTAHRIGKYSYATLAYERALMINPFNGRAKLELGRSYLAAGQIALAKQTLSKVLAMAPPERFLREAELMLAGIESHEHRSRMDLRIEVGGLWDDNVNVGPASSSIEIWPQTIGSVTYQSLDIPTSAVPIEAMGGFAAANVSGLYDFGKPGKWMMVGSLSVYQTLLEKVASDEQITFIGVSAGLRRASYRYATQLRWKYEQIARDGDMLATVLAGTPSLICWLGAERQWQLIAAGSVEQRDYASDYDGHDGPFYVGGLTARRFVGKGRGSVSVGVSSFIEEADLAIYESSGLEISGAFEAALPWNVTASVGGSYRTADFEEREILAPAIRKDTQVRMAASLRRVIGGSTRIDLSFRHTSNDSTFDLYEYERNVVSLSVLRAF